MLKAGDSFFSFWVGVYVEVREGRRRWWWWGGEASVVGVGVIVGDGAEKESVLRPGC